MNETTHNVPAHNELKLAKARESFGRNTIYFPSGIGVDFRGKSFLSQSDRADGIQLTTRWIIVCWLPLIPLRLLSDSACQSKMDRAWKTLA